MDRSDLSAAMSSVSLDAVNLSYYSKESFIDETLEKAGFSANKQVTLNP